MEKQNNIGVLAEKLAHALAKVEDEDPYVFDSEEVKVLQSVITFVERLRALRWFGKLLMYIVVAVGTLIVNWDRVKEWIFL